MFQPYESWYEVLLDAERSAIFWYMAPLDPHPVKVVVTKVFKNGKIRVRWAHGAFTADIGHRNRFFRRVTSLDY